MISEVYWNAIKIHCAALLSRPSTASPANGKFRLQYCFSLALSIAILAGSAVLGATVSSAFYFGLIALAVTIPATISFQHKYTTEKLLARIRDAWAKEDHRDRFFQPIALSAAHSADPERAGRFIDENTWADLNMDRVFSRLDRTLSSPGETVLYQILRTPETGPAALVERNRTIKLFQNNSAAREAVQLELVRLGREKVSDLASLLWSDRSQPVVPPGLLSFLALVAAAALPTPFFLGSWSIFILIAVFTCNLLVNGYVSKRMYWQSSVIEYLAGMIRCAGRLGRIDCPELAEYLTGLARLARITSAIPHRSLLIAPAKGLSGDLFEIVCMHICIYFLTEARGYVSILKDVEVHRAELKRIFDLIGRLDAFQSVASFRASLPAWSEPALSEDGVRLDLRDGRHPLLANPVPNSMNVDSSGILITGSNMAGKSTFLRTVAINAIMAQTIYTCCAASYRARFHKIISSINTIDQIELNKSFYLEEAERLLNIIRNTEGDIPCLCVIDELLIGTNSAERISASVEILDYLNRGPNIIMVSTHDIELARLLDGRYENYHFTDTCDASGLHFDYRIKKGISTTQNAIQLLEVLGYPKSIIDGARSRMKNALLTSIECNLPSRDLPVK